MHRSRPRAERQLYPGRGALRAESGVRLLFPSPRQRPAVRKHSKARATAGATDSARRRCARLENGSTSVSGVLSSLRYPLADFIGEDGGTQPFLPDGLPDGVAPVVSDGIHRLMEYQGASYAQLYVDRLRRFVGRRDVDSAMFGEIARLMAMRMSYEDPIRIAHLKLAEYEAGAGDQRILSTDDIRKFRLDELIGALPAVVAELVLDVLEWKGWTHKAVSIRFSTRSRLGIRRLKIEAGLRRWRLFSVRYAKERVLVERWLRMIDRSLTKQPQAAPAPVQTATMSQGHGSVYRRGLPVWNGCSS